MIASSHSSETDEGFARTSLLSPVQVDDAVAQDLAVRMRVLSL